METTKVKSFIESIYCTTHKQHPGVSIDGEDHVCIKCCCQQFHKQCEYLIKMMSRPGANQQVATVY